MPKTMNIPLVSLRLNGAATHEGERTATYTETAFAVVAGKLKLGVTCTSLSEN